MKDFSSAMNIASLADKAGIHRVRYALESGNKAMIRQLWDSPKSSSTTVSDYSAVSISSECVLGKMAKSISKQIQFPESSVFLHAIGCLSGAMTGRFKCELYHGTLSPVTLYTMISQPPSSGKSPVNNMIISPMISWYDRRNENARIESRKVKSKIAQINDEIKEMKKTGNTTAINAMYEDLAANKEKLESLREFIFPITDVTPEGLTRINNSQGMFHVISDEAGAVEGLINSQYGDKGKKTKQDHILKAWDASRYSVIRASEDGNMTFDAVGVICSIAQQGAVSELIAAGADRQNGLAERFLMIEEANMLGRRDHNNKYVTPDSLIREYEALVHAIMDETEVVLKVSDEARNLLNETRQREESTLSDGGARSNNLLRGIFGKMDKNITRIACVLHASREWSGSRPRKSRVITVDTMVEAMAIYNEIYRGIEEVVERQGYSGLNAQIQECERILRGKATGLNPKISFASFIAEIKKSKAFKGNSALVDLIKGKIASELESRNIAVIVNDLVYVNPEIK